VGRRGGPRWTSIRLVRSLCALTSAANKKTMWKEKGRRKKRKGNSIKREERTAGNYQWPTLTQSRSTSLFWYVSWLRTGHRGRIHKGGDQKKKKKEGRGRKGKKEKMEFDRAC